MEIIADDYDTVNSTITVGYIDLFTPRVSYFIVSFLGGVRLSPLLLRPLLTTVPAPDGGWC
jgi:hypothetical protein